MSENLNRINIMTNIVLYMNENSLMIMIILITLTCNIFNLK